MTYVSVLSELKKQTPRPLYLVTGNQPYLANQLRQAFRALVPESEQTMNFVTYDMETTPVAQALDDAMSAPFFGERRLVFIDRATFLTTEKGGKVDHDIDGLLQYIEHPEPTSVVVIFVTGKLDSRKKLVKTLKKQAEVVALEALGERQIQTLLADRLAVDGYTIDDPAFEQLQQRTGGDLTLMMNELPKLELACYDTKIITSSVVGELVTKTLDQNVFDLVNAVMAKKINEALTLYRGLILTKEEPLRINAVLVSQFRLLIQCQILARNGYSQGTIASTLKVHPYRVKLALQSLRHFQQVNLKRAYLGLIEIEKDLKSTSQDPMTLFELFMLKYASQAA
ncbi:DNA polymerase III subunit delta [Secundilactobacillus kimchicus]|uniref:DNA polymerase III subunit delta n=1 Tax=Secundilactobacillus kimchicus TaxID=528209 RepID=UPI0024A889E5|nr:DNA polymerase III subunit delta [Secundilactobacillus kimchicus]